MKGAALLLAFALAAAPAPGQDFEAVFGGRYKAAVQLTRERGAVWAARCAALGADPQTLVPVIFPELLRFSLLRSEVEMLGVATLYVQQGTRGADFSIGRFQMKPSFVETLERGIRADTGAPPGLRVILEFPGAATERDRRAARYGRLASDDWQLTYLACFYRLVSRRFALQDLPVEDRIRFLASAYNHGFQLDRQEIIRAEDLRCFPSGRASGRPNPWRYTDVAVDFYERYWRPLNGYE